MRIYENTCMSIIQDMGINTHKTAATKEGKLLSGNNLSQKLLLKICKSNTLMHFMIWHITLM